MGSIVEYLLYGTPYFPIDITYYPGPNPGRHIRYKTESELFIEGFRNSYGPKYDTEQDGSGI